MIHLHYIDDALLVAEKPAGLLSVPGRSAENQDCVVARLQALYPDALTVHRLDQVTSGLLLHARGKAMQAALSMQFEQRQVGVVNLRVEVDAQGRPSDVRVLSATNPGVFDAVSIAAARSWTYRPAMKNGKPVAAAVRIPITYAMDDTGETQ